MKKLVESFNLDEILNNNQSDLNNSSFRLSKFKKTTPKISNDDSTNVSSEIIIPQKLEDVLIQNLQTQLKTPKRLLKISKVIEAKQQLVEEVSQKIEIEDKQQFVNDTINSELRNQYFVETNEEIPEEVDVVIISEEIDDAIDFIPDANSEELTIGDFKIEKTTSKTGWTKGKVTIKSEVASDELSKIASNVKKQTNNEVLHRAMDFRTIGNTNKNQLKTSNFKLYSTSYVFRPHGKGQIKTTKYDRIIISVSKDDYNSTKRVLIFIQNSRDKFITEINMDIEFIIKLISQYYIVGFEATKSLLKSNSQKNPLNVFINKLMLTRKFLVKVLYKDDETFNMIVIKTKTGKHQWLKFYVKETLLNGVYNLIAKSDVETDWKGVKVDNGNKSYDLDIEYLMRDKTIEKLDYFFNDFNWSQYGMGEDDIENKFLYLMNKIKYRNLKNAFIEIYDLSVDSPELGIIIKETLSRLDTAKDINSGYQAELIIGKTNYVDYYILSWLGVQLKNNNSRKSSKQDRNTHDRQFMFQITYSLNNQKYSMIAKTFDEIKENTGFLTKEPKKI